MRNFILKLLNFAVAHPVKFFIGYFIFFSVIYGAGSYIVATDLLSESSPTTSETLLFLGLLAGLLQLIGYILYIKDEQIDPNPVTWFMFAYGTAILTVLEWDTNATFAELILPMTCSVLAIYVSARCWLRAYRKNSSRWWPEDWWPDDKWERWSFVSDIFITVAYIFAWCLATFALLESNHKEYAVLMFLFLSNLSTFPSFYPLLRETYFHPTKENWKPWMVWGIAYTVLALVTFKTHGSFWHPLMFYPISNAFLHCFAGLLALRPMLKRQHKPNLKPTHA